jgi:Cu+-exporting ATPase
MLTTGELLRWILCTPVQFTVGWQFYVGAYKSLRHGSTDMDVLVALGTSVAYFHSFYSLVRAATSKTFKGTDFFETSTTLISFIILRKLLKFLAKGKTSGSIPKLMELVSDTTTLLTLDDDGKIRAK